MRHLSYHCSFNSVLYDLDLTSAFLCLILNSSLFWKPYEIALPFLLFIDAVRWSFSKSYCLLCFSFILMSLLFSKVCWLCCVCLNWGHFSFLDGITCLYQDRGLYSWSYMRQIMAVHGMLIASVASWSARFNKEPHH